MYEINLCKEILIIRIYHWEGESVSICLSNQSVPKCTIIICFLKICLVTLKVKLFMFPVNNHQENQLIPECFFMLADELLENA